jgi:hypothetical protein
MVRKTTTIAVAFVIAYIVLGALLYVFGNAAIIVSALASVALVFVTLGLVIATLAYVDAANSQTEATNRQVAALTEAVVFFGVEEVAMVDQFFVQNVGPGIAYDIHFEVIKDFEAGVLSGNKKLSDLAFIKGLITALAPGQKIPFAYIDPKLHNNLIREAAEVEVKVIYKNKFEAKKPIERRFPFNFAYQEQLSPVRETPPDQLRKIADEVPKNLNRMAKGIEALKEKDS